MMQNTLLMVGLAVCGQLAAGTCVMESARRIPLVKETDVLVVGGSSAAVTAALAAKAAGADVYLVAPRPYLGDDIAGTLRLGLRYARDIYGAKRVSIAVFEDNEAALRCYRSVGFRVDEYAEEETYTIGGQAWKCRTLTIDLL